MEILTGIGLVTLIMFVFLGVIILFAIFIEEANSKIKFWRLVWRKFRRWLKK